MLYFITDQFSRISQSQGTVQNNSNIYSVEISNQPVVDSGFLLYPLNKFSFSGATLFARCVDGAFAELRVVPFLVDFHSSASYTDSDSDFASDDDADNIIDDAWNGNISSDPDADSTIDGMWNSSTSTDTADGFSDYLDDLFNP